MKARLIRDTNQNIVLLCNDGTIAESNGLLLYDLLLGFKREDNFFTGTQGRWDIEYPEISLYPGDTMAIITDNDCLVVYEPDTFASLMSNKVVLTRDFISVPEYAKKYDKSEEIIKVYCRSGRIVGAVKEGRDWRIPADAMYPIEPSKRREGIRGPRPEMRKTGK